MSCPLAQPRSVASSRISVEVGSGTGASGSSIHSTSPTPEGSMSRTSQIPEPPAPSQIQPLFPISAPTYDTPSSLIRMNAARSSSAFKSTHPSCGQYRPSGLASQPSSTDRSPGSTSSATVRASRSPSSNCTPSHVTGVPGGYVPSSSGCWIASSGVPGSMGSGASSANCPDQQTMSRLTPSRATMASAIAVSSAAVTGADRSMPTRLRNTSLPPLTGDPVTACAASITDPIAATSSASV